MKLAITTVFMVGLPIGCFMACNEYFFAGKSFCVLRN
jgi:hypothetical protein